MFSLGRENLRSFWLPSLRALSVQNVRAVIKSRGALKHGCVGEGGARSSIPGAEHPECQQPPPLTKDGCVSPLTSFFIPRHWQAPCGCRRSLRSPPPLRRCGQIPTEVSPVIPLGINSAGQVVLRTGCCGVLSPSPTGHQKGAGCWVCFTVMDGVCAGSSRGGPRVVLWKVCLCLMGMVRSLFTECGGKELVQNARNQAPPGLWCAAGAEGGLG